MNVTEIAAILLDGDDEQEVRALKVLQKAGFVVVEVEFEYPSQDG